ncbi:hypothetical protein [Leptolyngbya sp. FACHB-711]|uniref:hypothetical protein n=1 Tax=unclassified Leptolyngbya TaxID=2650499 RepID=UPI00168757CC|nr:hypothetical protein [Leptolyngbya sp. FACHB-711]MBD1853657.1 hypothetical protein [Cyanobacteria bacterium FACHB-502]MBD2026454.1 hypothetical protein [Leptolyngbya sp. FACHB-711]
MTSSESSPSNSNPVFNTPQPTELQSEETREAVLERLAAHQSQESDAIDPESTPNPNAKDAAFLDNVDGLENRHITRLDSPPG